jgi:hypothetical protein
MAFSLPTFNLTVHINRLGTGKGGGPDVVALANLAWGKRVSAPVAVDEDFFGAVGAFLVLLVPALTDVRDYSSSGGPDFVEAPAGSGRWYQAVYVDDIGKGFPNEHRAAVLIKSPPWPHPIP